MGLPSFAPPIRLPYLRRRSIPRIASCRQRPTLLQNLPSSPSLDIPATSQHAPAALETPVTEHQRTPDAVRVLIIGGTGRAGAQTARALAHLSQAPTSVTIAGRDATRGAAVVRSIRALTQDTSVRFASLDVCDTSALHALVRQHDVVLHAAGPFQRRASPNEVLRAALSARADYIDICDDSAHASDAKLLHDRAHALGVRAIVCAGIYPGLSNLAAASAASRLRGPARRVRIYYYTAGSGGIGATVLASTFLILSERARVYTRDDGACDVPAGADAEVVDFGGGIGKRTTYLISLPEVASLHETLLAPLGGGDVSAKFSTGPPIWNTLLQLMAKMGPKELMRDQRAMRWFAGFSLPVVRFVDMFSGARTAFLVRVEGDGEAVCVRYEHERLEESVGEATAAFVAEIVRDKAREKREIEAGVFYPEELASGVRDRICRDAVITADRFEIE